jgi:hypothetical protein
MVKLEVPYTGDKSSNIIDLGEFQININILMQKINSAKDQLNRMNNTEHDGTLTDLQTQLEQIRAKYENVVKDVVLQNETEVRNKYLKYKNKYLKLKNIL